jgi:hypothetical protein
MARGQNRRNPTHSYRSTLSERALFQISVDIEAPELRHLSLRSICNHRQELFGEPNSKLRKSIQNRYWKLRTLKQQNREEYWELYRTAREGLGLSSLPTPNEDSDSDIQCSDKDSNEEEDIEQNFEQDFEQSFRSLHITPRPPPQAEAMNSPPRSARRSGRPSPAFSPSFGTSLNDEAPDLPPHSKFFCFFSSCLLNTAQLPHHFLFLPRLLLDTQLPEPERELWIPCPHYPEFDGGAGGLYYPHA